MEKDVHKSQVAVAPEVLIWRGFEHVVETERRKLTGSEREVEELVSYMVKRDGSGKIVERRRYNPADGMFYKMQD